MTDVNDPPPQPARYTLPGVGAGPGDTPPRRPPRNAPALAAVVLALLGLVLCLPGVTAAVGVVLGVVAVVLGLVGRGRARRSESAAGGLAVAGAVLGAVAAVVGVVVTVLAFHAVMTFLGLGNLDSTPDPPISPDNDRAAPVTGTATSYIYEVTGNQRAAQLQFTDSDGRSVRLGNTGTTLPWSKAVMPDPNGGPQVLGAGTASPDPGSVITCTIKNGSGKVVTSARGSGPQARCSITAPNR